MIKFDNIYKGFGQRQVLNGLSLAVRKGEIFGFLAANGGGKTTAMRIAMGLLKADSGSVYLDGKEVQPGQVRGIGYMPEERGLYEHEPVAKQLKYLARLHKVPEERIDGRIAEVLASLNIEQHEKAKVKELSLGNQQRVQIAAAIIHDPDILILDEPFSGLDPVATDRTIRVLESLAEQGKSILFSSHQLDIVDRISHRIGLMEHGKLIFEGTAAEFTAESTEQVVVVTVAFQEGRGIADLDFTQCPAIEKAELQGDELELHLAQVDISVGELMQAGLRSEEIRGISRRQGNLLSSMSKFLEQAEQSPVAQKEN